ncbi:MAG: class I SAM-dependent DNA methyltransferase, partial [Chloroflexi bacterium]|nr:class I SAM-dependent DNA methyltransferase [Chloroflexota bacterium]
MTTPTLDVPTFIARWQAATLSERQGYQQHYLDLCRVLGHPTPAEIDATGSFYTFEKGVQKAGGGDGWADVWFRGHFAWEYKGKHKDLKAAYQQLLQYHDSLENPPLLVVCDLDRFEVHTKFTGIVSQVYAFDLADLARNQPTPTCDRPPLEVLRLLVTEPAQLRPGTTRALATEAAAAEFARLAAGLRGRGAHPEAAARFLMRLLFCLFAEDLGLLPSGVFTRLVQRTRTRPEEFGRRLRPLFAAMATGGAYGEHDIAHFNGGLFIERSVVPGATALADDDVVLDLTAADLAILETAARLDWGSIEPAILGTLFERSLEPDKRS